jgi:hypothetical protein
LNHGTILLQLAKRNEAQGLPVVEAVRESLFGYSQGIHEASQRTSPGGPPHFETDRFLLEQVHSGHKNNARE